ncbi:MAG: hypothetical protein ACYDC1_21955 [Limisphaerales bacterium]
MRDFYLSEWLQLPEPGASNEMKVAFDTGPRSRRSELPSGVNVATVWPELDIAAGASVTFILQHSDQEDTGFTDLASHVLTGPGSPTAAGSHLWHLQPDVKRFVRVAQSVSADAGSDPHRWSGRHFLECR